MDLTLRVSRLKSWQARAWVNVARDWEDGTIRRRTSCGVMIQRGAYAGRACIRPKGQGTDHLGFGHCVAHGGAKTYGRAYGAVEMAHAFAQEYDLSPWEALLYVIRITAGRVKYCEAVLATARSDAEIEGRVEATGETIRGGPLDGAPVEGRSLAWWVETSERERVMLAKVSKAAIDAGVAQLLVEQELTAGRMLADTMVRTYQALRDAGMPGEWLEVARTIMKTQLTEAGSVRGALGEQKAIEGEVRGVTGLGEVK